MSIILVICIYMNCLSQGIDLTKSTTATMSALSDKASHGQINNLTSLVTALPTQGVLGPYEKIPVFFRFSPR